jgi:transcription initiation factor IIE alpha subunit
MPCPKCGKDVEFLFCDTTEYATYAYDGEEFVLDSRDTVEMAFRCPECNEVVANDADEADEILKPRAPVGEAKAVEELARLVHEEEKRRREASAMAALVHEEERRRREASSATEA